VGLKAIGRIVASGGGNHKGCPYERWGDDAGVKRFGATANPQFIARHLQMEFSIVITFQVVWEFPQGKKGKN
jgi:hypothetical protein